MKNGRYGCGDQADDQGAPPFRQLPLDESITNGRAESCYRQKDDCDNSNGDRIGHNGIIGLADVRGPAPRDAADGEMTPTGTWIVPVKLGRTEVPVAGGLSDRRLRAASATDQSLRLVTDAGDRAMGAAHRFESDARRGLFGQHGSMADLDVWMESLAQPECARGHGRMQ
jgi:hypothetical protein